MFTKSLDRLLVGYDYYLPQKLIAQNPAFPRDAARLLVVDSPTHHTHRTFHDLPDLLKPGDLLVLNNTQVIRARLYGRKLSGALVEVLLVEERQQNQWLALVKPGKRLQPGVRMVFESREQGAGGTRGPHGGASAVGGECGRVGGSPDLNEPPNPEGFPDLRRLALGIRGEGDKENFHLNATVLEVDEATGGRLLQFELPLGVSLMQLLEEFGEVPMPPYITDSQADCSQYQTVYAQEPGAIAAPTAGLHFTPQLLEELQERGVDRAFVTLHVGVGTFRPVEVEDVTTHKMHGEWVEVPAETVEQIRATRLRGGRIIAVGTTAVRALEGAATSGQLQSFCGKTQLFIYPGYQWRVVQGLITNFHLPRSSLLMLVSALIGRQRLLELYQEAISSGYRFYSFGDAMLILPEARIKQV